jgi:hypothetical protein
MADATLELTPAQKAEIEGVVGHDLNVVKPDLGNVGGLKLTLTDAQASDIKQKTGKDLKVLELTEADLKQYSSIACYERGGIVVT